METKNNRGRPRRNQQENLTMVDEYLPKVHIVMRFLSKANVSNYESGETSGSELDAVLSGWVEKGYSIVHVIYAGTNVEGYGIIFVLQRN